jgi:hypothetical protein
MAQKKSRAERDMEALLKKIQKKVKQAPAGGRYQDATTIRDDENVEEALALFREMKRRDF